MFTIKAITDGHSNLSERIKLFSANRVLVAPAIDPESSVSAKPVGQPAQLRVHLMDERDIVFETIDVGEGIYNFNTVYVLNEKGRTIQTILPPSTHCDISVQATRPTG